MPFGPFPVRLVYVHKFVEHDPEILVLHRFLARTPPPVPFPPLDPLHDAAFYIFGICDDFDRTAFVQSFQAFDDGGKLHAIIRCVRAGSEQLALILAVAENTSPAALSWVALAGSVCNELNVLQATSAHSSAESSCN